MTKAHPKKLVGIQFDVAKDADVIERIYGQPSIVGYIRKLVRQDMQGDGYVELPKDADGEYIHIGDVMEFTYDPPQDQPMFDVSGFGANGTLFYAARGEVVPRKTTNASVVRHHHEPTVEDVLREFALACEDAGNAGPEVERIAAEFAAKLRLVEEDA